MQWCSGEFPYINMDTVDHAVWKRLMVNLEYQEIQKKLDDMLKTICRSDEQSFAFDLEEVVSLKEYHVQWEYYHQGMLDCVALLKWMGVLA